VRRHLGGIIGASLVSSASRRHRHRSAASLGKCRGENKHHRVIMSSSALGVGGGGVSGVIGSRVAAAYGGNGVNMALMWRSALGVALGALRHRKWRIK